MKPNQTSSNGQVTQSSWIERIRQQRQARRRELLSKQVEILAKQQAQSEK
ncbi:hypothetical protein [Actinobacillus minor]|nr:hypothetical protein [Actinobacillus minor]MDD6910959.1 hypothetical protein [Actinobacillus minor]MDY4713704.1 hypothetical protein [Actinobacillus minor]